MKSINIGNRVTCIEESTFYGCIGLTGMTIPNSVTNIKAYAFYNCSGLKSIVFPDGVMNIDDSAFFGCTGITGIYINNLTSWCNISFGNKEANPLYYAHNLYLNNEIIADLVIPSKVESIGDYAFYGCSSLTGVTIPDSVTNIGNSAFYGCSELTSVAISDLSAWSTISFGDYNSNPLSYAHSLYLNGLIVTDLIIPNNITNIGNYVFFGCDSLTSVTIPNSVTTIGNSAFSGCDGLTSVTIPDSVTSIGSFAFSDCTELTEIYYNAVEVSDFSSSSNIFYNAGSSGKGITVIFGNTVKSIPAFLFYNGTYIINVTIGNSVTRIGYDAFSNCTALTSIIIPNSVTSIEAWAFSFSGLTSATFENPYGWWCAYSDTATSGENIRELHNSSTAATYLKLTYNIHYWKRS